LCIRHNIQIKSILRRRKSHFGKTKEIKLFFKEPEEERKEKYFWTRHGLKVVILRTATITTDKRSSNCEFSLFFNFHLSLFSNSEFTQYLFPDYLPHLPHHADMEEHSEKGMEKM